MIYVMRNGKLVDKATAPPKDTGPVRGVISDTMTAMRHPITQQFTESKSQFRKTTKAYGCVEVGNDVQRDTRVQSGFDSASRKADIAQAIRELGG